MARRPPKPAHLQLVAQTWFKIVLSVLILVHLLAVISAPISLASRGTSIGYPDEPPTSSVVADTLFESLRGYTTFMFLNHGYSFFAPEPGPSHLMEMTATFDSGEPQQALIPNLKRQWPRLLYHRHFMIAETLNSSFPPNIPLQLRDKEWRAQRGYYQRLKTSLENHLKKNLSAKTVSITRILHDIPPLDVYQAGQRLDDRGLLRRFDDTTGNLGPRGVKGKQGARP